MSGIYAAIERNRRVYERLTGGNPQRVGDAVPSLQTSGWREPHEWPSAAPAGGLEGEGFGFPVMDTAPSPSEFPHEALSPAPPDPLETAELFTRAAETEERFLSQNLEREER